MFKNILVPLDGSPLSEAALSYAQALAKRTGASLTLVRAALQSSPLGATIDSQRAVMEAEGYLDSLSSQLVTQGFTVQTGVPFGGSAAGWIVEEISLRQADLVVMATHDRVGPDRWVHRSVAESVVNHAGVPVMLVRPTDPSVAVRFSEPQPVVIVPLDGSELAEAALPWAADFAQAIGARVALVGVVPPAGQLVTVEMAVANYDQTIQAPRESDVRAYLDACIGRVARAGAVSVETSVRRGEPASEIAAAAEERSAAAVVMATHGRTGLVRSILGSVAGGVLHHSVIPVMLIRPQELRPAEQPIWRRATVAAVC